MNLDFIEDDLDDFESADFTEDDLDDFESVIEDDDDYLEDDLDDFESSEGRRGRRRKRRGKRARRQQYFTRKLRGYCTKQECRAMGKRISADVARVKTRVNKNTARISNGARLNRAQSKAIKSVRKDADSTKQLVMLTSLLGGGDKDYKTGNAVRMTVPAQALQDAVTNTTDLTLTLPADTGLTLKEDGDSFDSLLPLMMLGGTGGSGGSGGFMGGDMMSLLILSKVLD